MVRNKSLLEGDEQDPGWMEDESRGKFESTTTMDEGINRLKLVLASVGLIISASFHDLGDNKR